MKKFTVTIEVKVSQNWIEDGFDLAEREQEIKDAFTSMLPYAYEEEVEVKIKKLTSQQLKTHHSTL
jgi:hypothetical protein